MFDEINVTPAESNFFLIIKGACPIFWKGCKRWFEIQGATLFWEQTGEEKELKGETRAVPRARLGLYPR